jgi:hypothetical protein
MMQQHKQHSNMVLLWGLDLVWNLHNVKEKFGTVQTHCDASTGGLNIINASLPTNISQIGNRVSLLILSFIFLVLLPAEQDGVCTKRFC